MSLDAQLPQTPSFESGAQRPMWSTLARWWSPAAVSADPALGYESALPWTLGVEPAERADLPY